MVTPIWLSGWEHGLAAPVISGTGICSVVTGTGMSVQSSIKRTGGYALKADGSAGETSITIGIPSAIQTDVFACTFYFRWDTLPNIPVTILRVQNNVGSTARVCFDPADQKIYGRFTSNGPKVNQVLAQSTWYRIDCKGSMEVNPTKLWYNVEGVGEQYTEYAQAVSVWNGYRFGIVEISPTINAGVCYWDDAVYSNTIADYPIGTLAVVGLRPDADGAHNNAANIMEDSAGNDIDGSTYYAYDKLDENPWTSTYGSDYVRQTGNGTGNYCEIQFEDISQSNIMGVEALLQYASATATSNTGGCIIRSNTTETVLWGIAGALADYSESSNFYKRAIVSPDGGSWTQTLVNALRCRFGYSSDANPDPYWQAIMLEVAYGPAGTQYPKTVDGTLTSAGALAKETKRSLLATLTSAGDLMKETRRSLTAILSTAGALVKQQYENLEGTLNSSGILSSSKIVMKSLDGTLTSAGVLIKEARRSLEGTLNSAGILIKETKRSFAAVLTTVGDLVKQQYKSLEGTLNSSGIFSASKVSLKSLEGTLTSTGILWRETRRSLVGQLTSVGILIRETKRSFIAELSSSGALLKQTYRSFTAILNSSGILSSTKVALKSLEGTLNSAGTLLRQTNRSLSGVLNSTGVLSKAASLHKAIDGILTSSGALSRIVAYHIELSGILTSSGTILKRIGRSLWGVLSAVGAMIAEKLVAGSDQPGTVDISDTISYSVTLNDVPGPDAVSIIDATGYTVEIGDVYAS